MRPSSTEAPSGYESDASSENSLHSDDLDAESHSTSLGKRQRPRPSTDIKTKKVESRGKVVFCEKQGKTHKARGKKRQKIQEESEEEVSDIDLKNGQEVVGKVVRAPKTGWGESQPLSVSSPSFLVSVSEATKGGISQHTLDFLEQLRNPDCNDRAW